MTPPTTASAEKWATDILRQLEVASAGALHVTAESAAEPEPGDVPGFTSDLQVWDDGQPPLSGPLYKPAVLVTLTHDDGSSVTVRLDEDMTQDEAVTLLADQLQQSVLESTGGTAVPPCPAGHGHPASAELVDGVASWTCPRGEARPVPVLDGA